MTAPPAIQLAAAPSLAGGQIQIDFTVMNYRQGMTFQLLEANAPQGAWTQDTSANLRALTDNATFRFTTSTSSATNLFFRVKGS